MLYPPNCLETVQVSEHAKMLIHASSAIAIYIHTSIHTPPDTGIVLKTEAHRHLLYTSNKAVRGNGHYKNHAHLNPVCKYKLYI